MQGIVIILAMATFLSTLIGGAIIIKFSKSLPYFFAFASGSLIAVAFLDILPESIAIANEISFPVRNIMLTIVISFFGYSLLERLFLTHELHEDSHAHIMGPVGAGSLVIHSFLDGAAIGAAFRVNANVGIIVALAVIFHDFTDGINTVTIMLKNKQKIGRAVAFLVLDALAPVLGVIVTSSIAIPEEWLSIILAIFVGEFIYIGAATLLPETRKHLSHWMIVSMGLGIMTIAVLTSFL